MGLGLCAWCLVLCPLCLVLCFFHFTTQRNAHDTQDAKDKAPSTKTQDPSHMPPDRFINQRKNAWQRLEELLKLLDHASLRRLHREEVRELGRIYRRTASDLAIARAESRDPRLVNYLNSLVIRAHGRDRKSTRLNSSHGYISYA